MASGWNLWVWLVSVVVRRYTVKGEIIVGLNNCVFADIWVFKHNCGLMIANQVFTWYRNCI